MSTPELMPEVGQIVAVRQRLYLVDQVSSPPNPSDSTLVQLSPLTVYHSSSIMAPINVSFPG